MILDILLGMFFINALIFLTVLQIWRIYMNSINQAIQTVQTALTALQGRLASGVVVQQSDLDAAAASITAVATTLGTLAN